MDLNSIARFPNFNLAINLSTSDICYTYPQALIGTIKKKNQTKVLATRSFSSFTLTKQTLLSSKWKELARKKQ